MPASPSPPHDVATLQGAGVLRRTVVLACLALAGYAVVELGAGLWGSQAWWQSILVWFLAAVVVHDLLLFPLLAATDRILVQRLPGPSDDSARVPLLNHVRVPLLAIGLTFLLFFPGILEQGASSYRAATGQTQEPFLQRWLWLSAVIVLASALVYGVRARRHRARGSHAR